MCDYVPSPAQLPAFKQISESDLQWFFIVNFLVGCLCLRLQNSNYRSLLYVCIHTLLICLLCRDKVEALHGLHALKKSQIKKKARRPGWTGPLTVMTQRSSLSQSGFKFSWMHLRELGPLLSSARRVHYSVPVDRWIAESWLGPGPNCNPWSVKLQVEPGFKLTTFLKHFSQPFNGKHFSGCKIAISKLGSTYDDHHKYHKYCFLCYLWQNTFTYDLLMIYLWFTYDLLMNYLWLLMIYLWFT
jgi:hypothetical protein